MDGKIPNPTHSPKDKILSVAAFAASVILFTGVASAVPITGGLGFAGGFIADNTVLSSATQITSYSNVKVTQVVVGSSIDSFVNVGDNVTLAQPFVFSPFAPVNSFWTVGGFTFNFLALTAPVDADATTLIVKGSGSLAGNGFDLTPGVIVLTYNSLGVGTLSFSSSTAATGVPDSGSTLIMLGVVMVGLGAATRWKSPRQLAPHSTLG